MINFGEVLLKFSRAHGSQFCINPELIMRVFFQTSVQSKIMHLSHILTNKKQNYQKRNLQVFSYVCLFRQCKLLVNNRVAEPNKSAG